MDQPIEVRPPEAADARGMAEAHVEAWRVGYRGLLPDHHLDGLDIGRRTEAWHEALTRTEPLRSTPVVAAVDGRVAGIAQYGPYREVEGQASPPELCELWMLNVHPEFWGTGVAQALMAEVVAGLGRTRSEPEAALWVLDGNARGRRFYEKEGWAADGAEQRATIGDREVVEVRYRRPLGPG